MSKEEYMTQALEEAEKSAEYDDVPVGAVVVCHGEIIARAGNQREKDGSAIAHAEVLAIEKACRKMGRWRLSDCELYVTLEPCPMCAGAVVNARIPRVFVGAKDAKAGGFGSVINLNAYPLNHKVDVEFGVMENECRQVLQSFFQKKRGL